VSIAWAPPTESGDTPVTGYYATSDWGTALDGDSWWRWIWVDVWGPGQDPHQVNVPAADRSHTFVTETPLNAVYVLTVQARNDAGLGPASSVSVTAAYPATTPTATTPAPTATPTATTPIPTATTPTPTAPTPTVIVDPPAANTTLRVVKVSYNPPGADTKANRNGEWVKIKNFGARGVGMTGYTLQNATGHIYRFPTTRLGAGKSLTVYTGRGVNTTSSRYWRSGVHIWNNSGREKAILRDSYERRVSLRSWISKPVGVITF
jgi:hypothetical protein